MDQTKLNCAPDLIRSAGGLPKHWLEPPSLRIKSGARKASKCELTWLTGKLKREGRMYNRTIMALACLAMSGAAQAMDAHSFYVKGVALKQQGSTALLTYDFQLLKREMESADKMLKAENARAKARGKPLYCAPATIDMTADQLLAEFRRIPQAQRQKISVRQAWREIAIRRFPCKPGG